MNYKDMIEVVKRSYLPRGAAIAPDMLLPVAIEYERQAYKNYKSSSLDSNIKPVLGDFINVPEHAINHTNTINNLKFMRRVDLLMFYQLKWTAFDIRMSREDFFRDTEEKRKAWMDHTHRFIYVTPPNLIRKEEVPENCGLWEIEGNRINIVKRASINKTVTPFPADFVARIFYRLSTAETKLRRKK